MNVFKLYLEGCHVEKEVEEKATQTDKLHRAMKAWKHTPHFNILGCSHNREFGRGQGTWERTAGVSRAEKGLEIECEEP